MSEEEDGVGSGELHASAVSRLSRERDIVPADDSRVDQGPNLDILSESRGS